MALYCPAGESGIDPYWLPVTPVRAHSAADAVGAEPAHGSLPDHKPKN